jgi:hypothetical protein
MDIIDWKAEMGLQLPFVGTSNMLTLVVNKYKTTPTFSVLPLKVLGLYSNNTLFRHCEE